MPRFTPAGARLRRYRDARLEALRSGQPIDEIDERREVEHAAWLDRALERSSRLEPERARTLDAVMTGSTPTATGVSRRDLLRAGALGAVALGGVGALTSGAAAAAAAGGRTSAPRIAVVGAGLAGLTAAYEVAKRTGWQAQVFEASTRVGGRVWTLRGAAGGQFLERGGGGVNSRDRNLLRLAGELGLTPLVDTWLNYPRSSAVFSFGGKSYTWPQLRPGVRAIEDYAWNIWRQIKYVPTHDRHNPTARVWDHRSVADLIDATAHPRTTPAGSYVAHWFGGEYGGRAAHASALHYVMDAGGAYPGGGFDERFCIPGGNDTLATTLAGRLPPGGVTLDRLLVALVRHADNTYRLTFASSDGSTHSVVADRVILAVPPTTLREVDLSRAGISRLHRAQIDRQPLGTGAKLNVQFTGQPWKDAGHTGDGSSDTSVQMSWSQQFQATDPANLVILDNLRGDYLGSTPAHGVAAPAVRHRVLRDLTRWYPTAATAMIPTSTYLDYWPNDPFAKGTWSFYDLGGFTTYGGVERRREGHIHFAGETTAPFVEHSTMCGAVTSGIRVAREIASY